MAVEPADRLTVGDPASQRAAGDQEPPSPAWIAVGGSDLIPAPTASNDETTPASVPDSPTQSPSTAAGTEPTPEATSRTSSGATTTPTSAAPGTNTLAAWSIPASSLGGRTSSLLPIRIAL
ncbi:hypothetical protein SY89_02282 [Halolamina pelagica]|uniref:Uncharacterized protein n=1 Tax=Halolamina pelagica TaxID=699431 RepID=A0A0P7GC81_9EURY|nr:hypothetical protein SY89_02282 [Halolamina pelagica]